MLLKNLKLGTKFNILFTVVLITMLILEYYFIQKLTGGLGNNIDEMMNLSNSQNQMTALWSSINDLTSGTNIDKSHKKYLIQKSEGNFLALKNNIKSIKSINHLKRDKNWIIIDKEFTIWQFNISKLIKVSKQTGKLNIQNKSLENMRRQYIIMDEVFNILLKDSPIPGLVNVMSPSEKDKSVSKPPPNFLIIIFYCLIITFVAFIIINVFLHMTILNPIRKITEAANKLANGDTNIDIVVNKIKYRGKNELWILTKSFLKISESIRNVIYEVDNLVDKAINGDLKMRANDEKFSGGYRNIIDGFNKTLDSLIGPFKIMVKSLKEISSGNIPQKVVGNYKGEFDNMKESLNTCIESVNAIVNDIYSLTNSAIEGKLSARIDISKHGGDFAKIVDGINKTLKSITDPINEVVLVLQKIENCNFNVEIKGVYLGDHAIVGESLNNTIENITRTMIEISKVAEQTAVSAKQLTSLSQSLSQSSSEQASSMDEISSTMVEVADNTKLNADNANFTNSLAISTMNQAASGNKKMAEMLNAIEDINASANNISKIIKIINEIAFQTNILAVNAAIEAARAGQFGRGFSVVADEVHNLAQRSSNAVNEITSLIENSISKVAVGVNIANETSEILNGIFENVSNVTNTINKITEASNKQSSDITQMNTATNQLLQTTQLNAANSEECAATSEELSSMADILRELVEKFELKTLNKSKDDFSDEILKPVKKEKPGCVNYFV